MSNAFLARSYELESLEAGWKPTLHGGWKAQGRLTLLEAARPTALEPPPPSGAQAHAAWVQEVCCLFPGSEVVENLSMF